MIDYPEMRDELIQILEALSDKNYQYSCWVHGNCPEGVEHDELDYSLHFLFDDTKLGEAPESTVGVILINDAEAVLLKELCSSIEIVLNKYGRELEDLDYIKTPEWSGVLLCAKRALDTIRAG